MNKLDILNTAGSLVRKTGFKLREHSPAICQGAGIVGIGVTIVLACKATLKLPQKTELFKKRLERVKAQEDVTVNNDRAVVHVYAQYAWDITKLYGPAAVLGVASIGSMCAATQILKNRNASLAAAYTIVDTGYKEYRKRVVDRFGEEVDKQLKFGATEETVKEKETDENGKTKTVKKKLNVIESKEFGCSQYARIFDETNPNFSEDHEYNIWFLRECERFYNKRLREDGRVFLNEIYKRLGFEPTKAGQIVGWTYNKDNPNGDNYISFGLDDPWHAKTRDFINGYEPAVILDFNVDGPIIDFLRER